MSDKKQNKKEAVLPQKQAAGGGKGTTTTNKGTVAAASNNKGKNTSGGGGSGKSSKSTRAKHRAAPGPEQTKKQKATPKKEEEEEEEEEEKMGDQGAQDGDQDDNDGEEEDDDLITDASGVDATEEEALRDELRRMLSGFDMAALRQGALGGAKVQMETPTTKDATAPAATPKRSRPAATASAPQPIKKARVESAVIAPKTQVSTEEADSTEDVKGNDNDKELVSAATETAPDASTAKVPVQQVQRRFNVDPASAKSISSVRWEIACPRCARGLKFKKVGDWPPVCCRTCNAIIRWVDPATVAPVPEAKAGGKKKRKVWKGKRGKKKVPTEPGTAASTDTTANGEGQQAAQQAPPTPDT